MSDQRFHLVGDLDNDRVRETLAWLYEVDVQHPGANIEFVITSPGGNMEAASAIFSELDYMSLRGGGSHYIHTKVRGIAGSGAALVLQAGDYRTAGVFDGVHMHRPHLSGSELTLVDMERELQLCQCWTEMFTDVVMARCNLSRLEFEDRLSGEWFVYGEEAFELGLVDAVF